ARHQRGDRRRLRPGPDRRPYRAAAERRHPGRASNSAMSHSPSPLAVLHAQLDEGAASAVVVPASTDPASGTPASGFTPPASRTSTQSLLPVPLFPGVAKERAPVFGSAEAISP